MTIEERKKKEKKTSTVFHCKHRKNVVWIGNTGNFAIVLAIIQVIKWKYWEINEVLCINCVKKKCMKSSIGRYCHLYGVIINIHHNIPVYTSHFFIVLFRTHYYNTRRWLYLHSSPMIVLYFLCTAKMVRWMNTIIKSDTTTRYYYLILCNSNSIKKHQQRRQ